MLTILGERRRFAGKLRQNRFVVVNVDGDEVVFPPTHPGLGGDRISDPC